MWSALIFALAPFVTAQGPTTVSQSQPTVYDVLEAEYHREVGIPVLQAALATDDTVLHRYAVRAIGRLRDSSLAPLLTKATASPSLSVRREAARAAGLLGSTDLLLKNGPLGSIRDSELRAISYESFGRASTPGEIGEKMLIAGLHDSSTRVRIGAARGVEAFFRRNARATKPSPATLSQLVNVYTAETDSEVRILLLLAFNSAAYRDSVVIKSAVKDTNAQVRRLGVVLGREWIENDPSPLVRYQALRVAGTCERAAALTGDNSEHVALLAIDVLGEKKCGQLLLVEFAQNDSNWRKAAHATVALARISSTDALPFVRQLAASNVWQARAWAAQAAKLAQDTGTLNLLARDSEPNVAAAAISNGEQALHALNSAHAGLLIQASTLLRQNKLAVSGFTPETIADSVRTTFMRITQTQPISWRDARVALLRVIGSSKSIIEKPEYIDWLRSLLSDKDPTIAALAKQILGQAGINVGAISTNYHPPPFPSKLRLDSLQGATASIRFRGKGEMQIRLLGESAPATVSTFVTLAESGAYNDKTIHRVVANFVLQGGSPGADEYDPLTSFFMRDEVGGSHARGTFGISTRGVDTGDGQIFINLVDNVRLDFDYTVFAETISGLAVMDNIGEGDVIESITIDRGYSAPTEARKTTRRGQY